MKFKRCAISFALLAVALGCLTLPASAATYKGTFVLQEETVWGAAVLEPGEYTIYTDSFGATPFFRIDGNGKVVHVMTGPIDYLDATPNGNGKLEISQINGVNVVTRFDATAIGRQFSFFVPKPLKKGAYPPVAVKKVTIPVGSAQ